MFWILAAAAGIAGLVGGLISADAAKTNAQSQLEYQIDKTSANETTAQREEAQAQAELANEQTASKSSADTELAQGMQSSYLQQVANENEYMDLMQQGSEAKGSLAAKTAASGIQQGTTVQQVLDSQVRDTLATKKTANNAFRDSSISSVINTQSQFTAGSAYSNLYQQKSEGLSADLTDTMSQLETQKSYLQDQWDSYDVDWWEVGNGKWWGVYGGGALGAVGNTVGLFASRAK